MTHSMYFCVFIFFLTFQCPHRLHPAGPSYNSFRQSMMDTFRMPYDWRKSSFWPEIRAAEILEDGGIRSCIVGDLVTGYYGGDIFPSDVHIAIADEQLEEARCMLLKKAFIEVPQMHLRFKCPSAITESTTG